MPISKDDIRKQYREASARLVGKVPSDQEVDALTEEYLGYCDWLGSDCELLFRERDGEIEILYRHKPPKPLP